MSLPIFNKNDKDFSMMQTTWAAVLDPLIAKPFSSGNLMTILDPITRRQTTKIPLVVGTNTLDHKLGRNLVGWIIVRQRALANIYDTQDTNTAPERTLLLVSDAIVTVDLFVF